GPRRPYEGQFGLYETHLQTRADQVDADSVIAALGHEWTLLETSIKPYPVCHFIHGCAEAALRIHQKIGPSADIAAIDCQLPAATLPIVAEPEHIKTMPPSHYDAKFSVQFVVAACLRLGRCTLHELDRKRRAAPALLELTRLTAPCWNLPGAPDAGRRTLLNFHSLFPVECPLHCRTAPASKKTCRSISAVANEHCRRPRSSTSSRRTPA